MKDKVGLTWIPIYIDKWLFGSMRQELLPDERSVWIDLLVLSGKDNGYIRANENTPYPDSQLSGMLCIPEELLKRTKEKGVQYGKLEITDKGTLRIVSYDTYKLSARHKRRFPPPPTPPNKEDKSKVEYSRVEYRVSAKADTMSSKADKDSKFESLWLKYPKKLGKEKAREFFIKRVITDQDWQDIQKALDNYILSIKNLNTEQKFIQYGSTWFNKNWRDWISFVEKETKNERDKYTPDRLSREPKDFGRPPEYYATAKGN